MNLTHIRTTAAAFIVAGAFAVTAASADLIAQGRPASPPGQASHPATPPAKAGSSPQTPQGQAGKPQTPPGQAKAPTPLVVKPALGNNLQPLLPAGTNLTAAAQGFKNLGAFVSAVHVAHNLDIPFATLKSRIVTDGLTLGGAIQALKPAANTNVEVGRAEKQARDDIAKSNVH